MKHIISWNVNGIRAAEKKGFLKWIYNCNADVVCIQETKASPSQLSPQILEPESIEGIKYKSYWASAQKAGYSGTAIFSKEAPDSIELLDNPLFDDEGRTITAKYGNLAVICAYFPNSRDAGIRLDYKLSFCESIFKYCNCLVSDGFNIVLSGDYNIAHKPEDLANPKANEKNAGYLPEERAWMDMFTANGYCDTFRKFCKEPKQYTWWSYRFKAREKNIGWRIDYQCVNSSFSEKVIKSNILPEITGSDHCPVAITLDI